MHSIVVHDHHYTNCCAAVLHFVNRLLFCKETCAHPVVATITLANGHADTVERMTSIMTVQLRSMCSDCPARTSTGVYGVLTGLVEIGLLYMAYPLCFGRQQPTPVWYKGLCVTQHCFAVAHMDAVCQALCWEA